MDEEQRRIKYVEVNIYMQRTIDSRVKGLETDHVHTFALYIEPSTVNIAPFNTS